MPGEREQAIRRRAYEIWQEEGRPYRRECDHSLQAERRIDAKPFWSDNGKMLRSYDADPAISELLGQLQQADLGPDYFLCLRHRRSQLT